MKEKEPIRETSLEELESFLFSLQRLRNEGQDMDDWIDITEQVIRLKIEDKIDAQNPSRARGRPRAG